MEKYYSFAGVEIAVSLPDEMMYEDDRTLSDFRVEAVRDPHTFNFSMTDALEPPKGELIGLFPGLRVYKQGHETVRYIGSLQDDWCHAYIRATRFGNEHLVQLKASQFRDHIGVKTVLNSLEAEHLVAMAGGFILHSAFIEWQGKAILFTAPSGTGKSTQADLWHKLRAAEIINGDRSAVRIEDGQVLAAGVPFAGSSKYCKNRTLPLAAVVYLGQAPETTIEQLRGVHAFRRIWEGCSVNTWDKVDLSLVSDTVQKVIEAVPVYCLRCTPDESAVIALEQALKSRRIE